MKLTKFRLLKQLDKTKTDKQTRRKFKKDVKLLNHTNTYKNIKQFNLKNKTLKKWL